MTGSPDVRIELQNRIAAVALMQRLTRHGSYLIQRTPETWVVHARSGDDAMLAELLERVEEWDRAHPHGGVTVHCPGRTIDLPPTRAAR